MKQGWQIRTKLDATTKILIRFWPKGCSRISRANFQFFWMIQYCLQNRIGKAKLSGNFHRHWRKTGRAGSILTSQKSGVRGWQAVTCLPHRVIDFLFWYLKDIIMYKSYLILDHLTINNSPTEENSTKNKKYLHSFWVEVMKSGLANKFYGWPHIWVIWVTYESYVISWFFYRDEINNKQILTAK